MTEKGKQNAGKTKTPGAVQEEAAEMARALEKSRTAHYLLRLYISGSTPKSMRAIANIRKICDEHLKGRYELEVVDIYQQKDQAKTADILAAPTLIKKLPLPLRKMIGDMANTERILVGLDLSPKE